MPEPIRQKITFAEMRTAGAFAVSYCSDYGCSHSIAISADQWPDDLRLTVIEPRFVCQACGKRGADVRPKFSSAEMGIGNRRRDHQSVWQSSTHFPGLGRSDVDRGESREPLRGGRFA
jgi:hypothetical protein